MIYRFGDYALDLRSHLLRRGGEEIALEPQVFALLACLIERRDRLVTKDELVETVWGGRIVADATLSSRISAARQAVGDSGEKQAVIRTVPRLGFRFLPQVALEPAAAAARPPVAQSLRYCTTPDGIQLAYALAGAGPPLVKAANWLNHLEFDWHSPIWQPLFAELTGYRRLLRYDSRGTGLSDRTVEDFAFPVLVTDLETVVEAVQPPPFALLGISQGAAIAIDYAVRHPQRVTQLILWGGFARGRRQRGNAAETAESEAFATLIRQGWGNEAATFRKMFAALFLPEATEAQARAWTEMQRLSATPEVAARLREAIDRLDVSRLLARVRTPTLILHSARDVVAPLAEARLMAARIPEAELVLLDSANHLVLSHEPAWPRALAAIRAFLGGAAADHA